VSYRRSFLVDKDSLLAVMYYDASTMVPNLAGLSRFSGGSPRNDAGLETEKEDGVAANDWVVSEVIFRIVLPEEG